MMKHEFEALAGYEVSDKDYNEIIEPMYMAIPDRFSKADFVAMIDKKRFALPTPAALLRQVRKEAAHLAEICGRCTDYESEQRMERAAKQYASRKYGLNWSDDMEVYVYFLREYEYPEIGRGCTYPVTMVIGRGQHEYERTNVVTPLH